MSDGRKDERGLEGMGEKIGSFAGRMAGMAGDAAMDATGAIFNSMAQMLGSWWSGDDARRAASSFGETDDQACREHFQRVHTAGESRGATDYSRTRPYYQFGYVARQNPSYSGRSFSEIEPELRRAWSSSPQSRDRDWDEVRDYVGFSYQRRPTGSSGEVLGL
jgi:hypothetical protein